MAILAVVLDILAAWPSHIIFSLLLSYSFSLRDILAPSPPKMSGLLVLRLYKFFLMSTSSLSLLKFVSTGPGRFFWPRHVFKCFVIYDAKILFLQIWHCCKIYFFLGADMIFSYKTLLEFGAWIMIFYWPLVKVRFLFLDFMLSKTIVSTIS